jgi:heme/copper-type cytochrome/quinol oxidase subunit 4
MDKIHFVIKKSRIGYILSAVQTPCVIAVCLYNDLLSKNPLPLILPVLLINILLAYFCSDHKTFKNVVVKTLLYCIFSIIVVFGIILLVIFSFNFYPVKWGG